MYIFVIKELNLNYAVQTKLKRVFIFLIYSIIFLIKLNNKLFYVLLSNCIDIYSSLNIIKYFQYTDY